VLTIGSGRNSPIPRLEISAWQQGEDGQPDKAEQDVGEEDDEESGSGSEFESEEEEEEEESEDEFEAAERVMRQESGEVSESTDYATSDEYDTASDPDHSSSDENDGWDEQELDPRLDKFDASATVSHAIVKLKGIEQLLNVVEARNTPRASSADGGSARGSARVQGTWRDAEAEVNLESAGSSSRHQSGAEVSADGGEGDGEMLSPRSFFNFNVKGGAQRSIPETRLSDRGASPAAALNSFFPSGLGAVKLPKRDEGGARAGVGVMSSHLQATLSPALPGKARVVEHGADLDFDQEFANEIAEFSAEKPARSTSALPPPHDGTPHSVALFDEAVAVTRQPGATPKKSSMVDGTSPVAAVNRKTPFSEPVDRFALHAR